MTPLRFSHIFRPRRMQDERNLRTYEEDEEERKRKARRDREPERAVDAKLPDQGKRRRVKEREK